MDVYDTELADRDRVVRGSTGPGNWDDIPENLRPDRRGPVWPFVLAGFMFLVGAAAGLL